MLECQDCSRVCRECVLYRERERERENEGGREREGDREGERERERAANARVWGGGVEIF